MIRPRWAETPQIRERLQSPAQLTPTLIVLGRDASGKAHASWFGEGDAALAAKGGPNDGHGGPLGVATRRASRFGGQTTPRGDKRVFASGRAFVPFVRASLFDELV